MIRSFFLSMIWKRRATEEADKFTWEKNEEKSTMEPTRTPNWTKMNGNRSGQIYLEKKEREQYNKEKNGGNKNG